MVVAPAARALVASVIPVKPPARWFRDPKLRELTPLTVDPTGRVYGHVAGWNTTHIGLAGSVKPPKSRSKYAFFKTGVVECDNGDMVDVGQITLTGGHAPIEASAQAAVKHYDDTQSGVMDVTVGEDRHGIWVAGALRPTVTPEQIRSIRASGVSGDWRPINGRLELVAICSVPVPGFPIPRARVASGRPVALVAAGSEPLVELAMKRQAKPASPNTSDVQVGMEALANRLKRVERVVLASAAKNRQRAQAAVVAAGAADSDRAAELRKRVHREPVVAAASPDDRAEQLRRRVHKTKETK